ncbi:DUF4129 domain-containing protein [Rhodoflexus sp.]
MKQKQRKLLITCLVAILFTVAESIAQSSGDDIWKQLPATQPAYGKDRVESPINPKKQDKSAVRILKFDSAAIAAYLSNDEFLYDRPKISSESIKKRFRRWLREKLDAFFKSDRDGKWIDYFFYIIAATIISFVIARILGLQPGLFVRKRSAVPDEFIIGSENIHAISFENAIAAAEAQGDLRYAIRLQYLQLLKHLSDNGMIRWEPQKTNMQYVAEMSKTQFNTDFESVTRSFAYTWYGHFEVNPAAYQSFKERQQALRRQTNKAQTAQV